MLSITQCKEATFQLHPMVWVSVFVTFKERDPITNGDRKRTRRSSTLLYYLMLRKHARSLIPDTISLSRIMSPTRTQGILSDVLCITDYESACTSNLNGA